MEYFETQQLKEYIYSLFPLVGDTPTDDASGRGRLETCAYTDTFRTANVSMQSFSVLAESVEDAESADDIAGHWDLMTANYRNTYLTSHEIELRAMFIQIWREIPLIIEWHDNLKYIDRYYLHLCSVDRNYIKGVGPDAPINEYMIFYTHHPDIKSRIKHA